MVHISQEQNGDELPVDATTADLLATSIRDYTKNNKLELSVTKVGNAYGDDYGNVGMRIELFTDGKGLEKLRGYEIKDNKHVIEMDDYGKKIRSLRFIEGDEIAQTPIAYHLKMNPAEKGAKVERGDNDIPVKVTPYKKCFPIIAAAFIGAGELPDDFLDNVKSNTAINTTPNEIREVLEGFEFIGSYEHIKLNKYAYDRLNCSLE